MIKQRILTKDSRFVLKIMKRIKQGIQKEI